MELERLRMALRRATGAAITDADLAGSITATERIRARIRAIRRLAFTAPRSPIPALELLLTEILALHFCSDRERCGLLLDRMHAQVAARAAADDSHLPADAVRVYWVNPVADLRVLNWLEDCGGRLCGTDFMTSQSLVPLVVDASPIQALARAVLCDRMIGGDARRARLIAAEARQWDAEAVVVARIPGASHCAGEGMAVARAMAVCGLPVVEIEVPPLADADAGQIRGRLEALLETARERRSVRT
jgi:benzoyl-CoA reductase/2-hydroxyglutaryl-CoA dehydratase subunit BcrC/BadD/HgdB